MPEGGDCKARMKARVLLHLAALLWRVASLAAADGGAQVILAAHTESMRLRHLRLSNEIAADNNGTIVFPLPMDLREPLLKRLMN